MFELSLPDGRLGYGIVVKRGGLSNGGTPYVAIFSPAYECRPDIQEITSNDVVLQGWTMDALVYHGRWNVIGHNGTEPAIQFPIFKVLIDGKIYVVDVEGKVIDLATSSEIDVLDHRFSSAPIIFQDAFEALHGFGEWKDHYDKLTPAYVQPRADRPRRQR